MADSESDAGYRSRSQSRRRRRQNQRQRAATSQAEAGDSKASAQAMTSVPEAEESPQTQLDTQHPSDVAEMQPFGRIKPPGESMDGPVTYARAMRGEIPMRGAPPKQDLGTTQQGKTEGSGDIMEQDGLKLRLELNLDIEIELKASIHGDLTLAIMS